MFATVLMSAHTAKSHHDFIRKNYTTNNKIKKHMNKQLKNNLLLILIVSFGAIQAQAQSWQIKKGEKLTYKIAFNSGLTGDVKGGNGVMSVSPKLSKINGKDAYHAVMEGSTSGVIEWFYQVENKYETFIDTATKAPLMYAQYVRENKYKNNDTVFFDQNKNIATYKNKKIKIPANTHDFLSMLYYVRTLDMSKLKKGDTFTIPFFTQDKVVNSKIIYNGIEKVKNRKLGLLDCYSFKPEVAKGKVFNQDYPATMWVTADNQRLPVLVEAKMKVGKVKMELIKSE